MTVTLAAVSAAAVGLLAAPYLAGLTTASVLTGKGFSHAWRWRSARGRRTAATAAVAIALAALAGVGAGAHADWPAYLTLALAGTVLTLVDLEHHKLPRRILLPAAVAGTILLTLAAAVDHRWGDLTRAALAAATVLALSYLVLFASPRSIGRADVKLAGLLAGYLGWCSWTATLTGFALGLLAAGIVAATLLAIGRRDPLPLGPFLIPAALVVLALER